MELLAKLQKEKGISFVFICHDLFLVQAFAHQAAVMYLGNLVEVIPGDQVRRNAIHPYTKALLEAVFSIRMDFTKEITSIESEAPSPLHIRQAVHSKIDAGNVWKSVNRKNRS